MSSETTTDAETGLVAVEYNGLNNGVSTGTARLALGNAGTGEQTAKRWTSTARGRGRADETDWRSSAVCLLVLLSVDCSD